MHKRYQTFHKMQSFLDLVQELEKHNYELEDITLNTDGYGKTRKAIYAIYHEDKKFHQQFQALKYKHNATK